LGATNDDLAGCFEVACRTIDDWIVSIPQFAEGGAGRRRRGLAERARRWRRAGAPYRMRVMQAPRDLTVTTFTRRYCYS
jgi:hypothetical protein